MFGSLWTNLTILIFLTLWNFKTIVIILIFWIFRIFLRFWNFWGILRTSILNVWIFLFSTFFFLDYEQFDLICNFGHILAILYHCVEHPILDVLISIPTPLHQKNPSIVIPFPFVMTQSERGQKIFFGGAVPEMTLK